MTPEAYKTLKPCDRRHPLAAVIHGSFTAPDRPWPQIHSQLRPLDREVCIEVFFSDLPVIYRQHGVFQRAFSNEVMFCGASLDADQALPLTETSEKLYGELFAMLAGEKLPHLLRIWNILADINQETEGLERYKQFCLGRHRAFEQFAPELADLYPSASAVGAHAGGLTVYAIAAQAPGITVENPNQVSAYRYPPRYGPKSPSFSRALVKQWEDVATLFISGTASITGHLSRHLNDCSAQVEMTMDNIETLVKAANDQSAYDHSREVFTAELDQAILKIFVRNQEDLPDIQAAMKRRLGQRLNSLILEADLCRAELLFEVEGAMTCPAKERRQRAAG